MRKYNFNNLTIHIIPIYMIMYKYFIIILRLQFGVFKTLIISFFHYQAYIIKRYFGYYMTAFDIIISITSYTYVFFNNEVKFDIFITTFHIISY